MIRDEESARAWLERLPEYDAAARTRLSRFVAMLAEENAHQNLVAASSLAQIWTRHIADSAQLLRYVPRETGSWLDLGTGAGFPGVIVAILRPDIAIGLVEARVKRAQWLNHVVATLDLAQARVISTNLELVEARAVAVISARAFAPLGRLLKLAARFSTADTLWLLPKGRSAAHELQGLTRWQHMFHVEQSLTDSEAGIIVGQLIGKEA